MVKKVKAVFRKSLKMAGEKVVEASDEALGVGAVAALLGRQGGSEERAARKQEKEDAKRKFFLAWARVAEADETKKEAERFADEFLDPARENPVEGLTEDVFVELVGSFREEKDVQAALESLIKHWCSGEKKRFIRLVEMLRVTPLHKRVAQFIERFFDENALAKSEELARWSRERFGESGFARALTAFDKIDEEDERS